MRQINGYWLATIGLIVIAFLVSAAVYPIMPDRIPIHWNIKGQVDGYGSRAVGLFLMPAVMAGMALLFAALPALSPKNFEVDTFRSSYLFVVLICTALFGYIHGVALVSAWQEVKGGPHVDMPRILIGGMMLFFCMLGNVMGKIRRNFYIGVKTPWTLASDRVWNDTHRLAAWLMVGAGAGGFCMVIAGLPILIPLAILIVAALYPVGYSYFHYKTLERNGTL